MFVYTNTELKKHILQSLDPTFRERFLLADLHKYVTSQNNIRVCCLYGLRRTGKTIMTLQEIKNLESYESVLLIVCEGTDTMWEVREIIEANPSCNIIFIDEITKVPDFIGACSFLANHYAMEGRKIILSGADSLGFFLAKNDELYDRAQLIHTAYISFKEYNYLLNKDIKAYIEYGGTLDGEAFGNNDRLKEYINTAIAYNIANSLQKWRRGVNCAADLLGDIIERNDLPSFINKVMEYQNRTFLAKIINNSLKSDDLGSLAELTAKGERADAVDTKQMSERIRIFLGVKENLHNFASEKAVNVIIDYLKALDVLYQLPHAKNPPEFIFIQSGMRYCQTAALADTLILSDVFSGYTSVRQHTILNKLKEDICGGILEDIVFYQLAITVDNLCGNTNDIIIDRYQGNKETGIMIEDLVNQSTLLIEVRFSDKPIKEQLKQLIDTELCNNIEAETGTAITNKLLLYRGKSFFENSCNVLYFNAETLLINTEDIIGKLLGGSIMAFDINNEQMIFRE